MLWNNKDYIVYVTGSLESEALAKAYLNRVVSGYVIKTFKFYYVDPFHYDEFSRLIRFYQRQSQYRPFVDEANKKAIMILDMSEWLTHENEEFLTVIAKFLHDDQRFFNYAYLMTVGDATKNEAMPLYQLFMPYLNEAAIVEENEMSIEQWLRTEYSMSYYLAQSLNDIISSHNYGLSEIKVLMNDFYRKLKIKTSDLLTEDLLYKKWPVVPQTKLYQLYEKEMTSWYDRQHDVRQNGRILWN